MLIAHFCLRMVSCGLWHLSFIVFVNLPGAELFDDAQQLKEQCRESNVALGLSLREDKNAAELHRLTIEDANLGRMTHPVCIDDLGERFAKVEITFSHTG